MHTYYIKKSNKIYRFKTYADLANTVGVTEKAFRHSLVQCVRNYFPDCELSSHTGALFKGWIDLNGNPTASLMKGNYWENKRGSIAMEDIR